jgi:hypothetical protein
MGKDELGTPCALRRGEGEARQTREFADALFEHRQEITHAGGMEVVQVVQDHLPGIDGGVVENSCRCRRQLRVSGRLVIHRVLWLRSWLAMVSGR